MSGECGGKRLMCLWRNEYEFFLASTFHKLNIMCVLNRKGARKGGVR